MTYGKTPATKRGLSRREMLALSAGGIGAGLACICGAGGILAYLLSQDDDDSPLAATTPLTPTLPDNVLIAPYIIPRADWGGLEPNHQAENENGFATADNPEGWFLYPEPLQIAYTTVVIHHSVVYEDNDQKTMLAVQELHREDNGWADIGYHFLIGKEGAIYAARPLEARGVHVARYNTGSAGVCLMGNFMEELPTEPQLASLTALVTWLAAYLELTHIGWHRQFNDNTVCPGDNLVPHMNALATATGLLIGTEGYRGPTATPASKPLPCPCGCALACQP